MSDTDIAGALGEGADVCGWNTTSERDVLIDAVEAVCGPSTLRQIVSQIKHRMEDEQTMSSDEGEEASEEEDRAKCDKCRRPTRVEDLTAVSYGPAPAPGGVDAEELCPACLKEMPS